MNLGSMYAQVTLLKALYHAIAIGGFIFYPMEYWWVPSILGYFIFTRIGSDVGFHRYFTHHSFKTSRAIENFLLILGTLDCKGSMFSWVVSHHAHHKHADHEGDPHSPHRVGFLRVWLIDWEHFSPSKKAIAEYVRRPLFRWTHDYYLLIVLGFMLFLGILDLRLLIYFYCVPMVYSIHMNGIINTVGHSFGYRNFETNDGSRNNLWVNLLSLGSGLHNNHHAFPNKYDQSSSKRWHEVDPAAWVVGIIQKRYD